MPGFTFAFGSAPTIVKVKAAKRTAGGDSPGERMFTIGVDFGTNSVRALVVRCSDGAEYGSRVVDYPSGAQGVLLDPLDGHLARQNPADYLVGLEKSLAGALAEAAKKPDFGPAKVVGIGVDTTGSSPIPVDATNRPLALAERWRRDLSGAVLALEGPHQLARSGQDHRAPAPSIARNTSPSAATPIPRNGSGPRSGIA